MSWKPKPRPDCDFGELELSNDAAFVLAHVDGSSSVADLSREINMPESQVTEVLSVLVEQGAIQERPGQREVQARSMGSKSNLPDLLPPPEPDLPDLDQLDIDQGPSLLPDPIPQAPDQPQTGEAQEPAPEEPPEDPAQQQENKATHRKLFETQLHQLDEAVRVKMASVAEDPQLSAFCFDPNPKVVRAIFENLKTGMAQARLIAEHHRSGTGLEALGRRTQFLRDNQVRRMLFRNNQTPDGLYRKMLEPLPLIQVFKSTLGRESTERAKRNTRQILRQKFQRAQADEKVGLIFNTEGRCLTQLVGLHFDQKTTMLLCRRPINSMTLVQNLARFAASPPKLIQHLLKQNLVRRSPHLKKLLQRHSNCPAALKRG